MLECIMSYNQEESCKDRKGHWPLVRGSRQDWSLVKYWENELVWNLGIEIDYEMDCISCFNKGFRG